MRYEVTADYETKQPVSPALAKLKEIPEATLNSTQKIQKKMMEAELDLATKFTFVAYTLKPEGGTWTKDETLGFEEVRNTIPTELPPI